MLRGIKKGSVANLRPGDRVSVANTAGDTATFTIAQVNYDEDAIYNDNSTKFSVRYSSSWQITAVEWSPPKEDGMYLAEWADDFTTLQRKDTEWRVAGNTTVLSDDELLNYLPLTPIYTPVEVRDKVNHIFQDKGGYNPTHTSENIRKKVKEVFS